MCTTKMSTKYMVIIMGDGQAHVEGVFNSHNRRDAVIMAMHWNNHFFGSRDKDFFAEVQRIMNTWKPKKGDYEFEDNGEGGNGVVIQSMRIPKMEKRSQEEVECIEEGEIEEKRLKEKKAMLRHVQKKQNAKKARKARKE